MVSPMATLSPEKVIVSPLLILPVVPFESVTLVEKRPAVTDATLVPDAIPAPLIARPDVTLAGSEAKVKVVPPLFVVPVVGSVTVRPTGLERVTVVPLLDSTVVPDGIAEALVVSVTPMPAFIVAGTDAKNKVV